MAFYFAPFATAQRREREREREREKERERERLGGTLAEDEALFFQSSRLRFICVLSAQRIYHSMRRPNSLSNSLTLPPHVFVYTLHLSLSSSAVAASGSPWLSVCSVACINTEQHITPAQKERARNR